jgi:hypothetical protein
MIAGGPSSEFVRGTKGLAAVTGDVIAPISSASDRPNRATSAIYRVRKMTPDFAWSELRWRTSAASRSRCRAASRHQLGSGDVHPTMPVFPGRLAAILTGTNRRPKADGPIPWWRP